MSGGPIVEQATHFVDLMRFFAGEILEDTVKAVAVGPDQKLSDMAPPPQAEHEVSTVNYITSYKDAQAEDELDIGILRQD